LVQGGNGSTVQRGAAAAAGRPVERSFLFSYGRLDRA